MTAAAPTGRTPTSYPLVACPLRITAPSLISKHRRWQLLIVEWCRFSDFRSSACAVDVEASCGRIYRICYS
jgi:hypothetical protein